jgi:hypothetical protein
MRRFACLRRRQDPALSAMMDVFLVVLVVTIALVGTWVLSFSGESRRTVQIDEYNIHFATLTMERWLGSTVPEATVVDSLGNPMDMKDQKVLELIGIELVILRLGAKPAALDAMELELKSQLDVLLLPDHHYAANAVDTSSSGGGKSKGPIGEFFFISSEPVEDLPSYERALDGHPTYTGSHVYQVPQGLGGSKTSGPLQLTVNLACWVE